MTPANRLLPRPSADAAAPRISFQMMSLVDARNAGGWERHRHTDHEAILVDAGTYRCRVNGTAIELAPGGLLLVKPGDWHEDQIEAGTRYRALWFRLAGGHLVRPDADPARQAVPRCKTRWLADLDRVTASAEAETEPARLDAEVAPLVWIIASLLPAEILVPPFAPVAAGFARDLERAFARIRTGGMRVAALARELGMSQRSLERHCHDTLDCGPAQAFARWRLERAAAMLLATDWPVRAVSDSLGFANPFHFSRAFARHHGQPPGRWRERGGNR